MKQEHVIPPATAFYFELHFMANIEDMAFMEVSGMSTEIETQEIDVGGGHKRRIPVSMKHGNLVCRRPMKPIGMDVLSTWISQTMMEKDDKDIMKCNVLINLLSPQGTVECRWMITDAYPVKWDVSGLDVKKNFIALETIEFAYDKIERVL